MVTISTVRLKHMAHWRHTPIVSTAPLPPRLQGRFGTNSDQETIPDYCPVVLRFLEISEMTA